MTRIDFVVDVIARGTSFVLGGPKSVFGGLVSCRNSRQIYWIMRVKFGAILATVGQETVDDLVDSSQHNNLFYL